jgi:aspartate racemase
VSVVADEIRARGLSRVALLGTRSTVESRMFGRLGVEVVVPPADEIALIHAAYLDVVYDRSTPETIERLRGLAHTMMARDGAQAVLLAGTDLSMVLDEENAGFPTIDCAGVHIREITRRLLS